MYYFIVNPASRSHKGALVWEKVENYLKNHDIKYQVYFSKRPGHVAALMKDLTTEHLNSETAPNIIVMGGDGTLDESLQGIMDFTKVNIGYIPTGSGNDFASAFAYSDDPIVTLKHILSVKMPRLIDLGRLKYENMQDEKESIAESRYFDVSCGMGFDASICEQAMESKAKTFLNKLGLGKLIYGFVSLRLIFNDKLTDAVLKLDNEEEIEFKNFRFIVGMNTCFEGGGFKFAPDAKPDDGFLDICAVGEMSPFSALSLLPLAPKGRHVKNKNVHIYRVKSFEITTKAPLWVHTDGEVYAKSSHVKVSVQPKKLRFLY